LTVSVSRLRALGLITPEMAEFVVRFGDVTQSVVVKSLDFPNGGGWSLFIAPCCGRPARVLKLLDGRVLCWRCCYRRGAPPRVWSMSRKQRAEHRAPKLRAMLESKQSLRLKPVLRGTMERRKRHEAALARCEFIISRKSRRFRDVQIPEIEPEPIRKPKATPSR
jgi:hypothetical protein